MHRAAQPAWLFTIEHRPRAQPRYADRVMELQKIKKIVAAGWMLTVLAVIVGTDLSGPIQLALAAVGLLPPLALLLWWNEPSPTMSEAINRARR